MYPSKCVFRDISDETESERPRILIPRTRVNRSLGCPEPGIICVKVPPEGGVTMRRIIGDAARAVAVYLAWVLGGAAVGALVGQLVWGQWFLGALAAGGLLAFFALPTGITEANWGLWRPFYRPTPPTGREREEDY
jgi:hypothetical protein